MSARGMTLIEVMVALVIATVGLLGALAMNASMVSSSTFSRQVTEATSLVQQKVEEQEARVTNGSCPSSTPVVESSANNNALNALGTTAITNGSQTVPTPYTRTTQWGTLTSNGFTYCTLKVYVTWVDGANNSHSVEADTQRAP